jgi:nitrite reductase/ring-hydroxylating ferredoxin subunit
LVDNSRIYHSDVNYNFQDIIDFDIQVGGSIREYQLNSFGRIYTDKDGLYYTVNTECTHASTKKKVFDDRFNRLGALWQSAKFHR